jgi:hypothetical protein
LHAFLREQVVGRSEEYRVLKRKVRKRGTFAQVADPMGPWFDGVEYLGRKGRGRRSWLRRRGRGLGFWVGGRLRG